MTATNSMRCSGVCARSPGVTVLIYDQTCAAEKRRRRKKGEFPDPAQAPLHQRSRLRRLRRLRRAVELPRRSMPVETELGRKRRIDQSSLQQGLLVRQRLLPELRRRRRREAEEGRRHAFDPDELARRVDALPQPDARISTAPYDMLVTGVGGTGVVTVGALISMAAHLEGKSASVLDFMGFAQKGGSVLSFVRLAARRCAAEPGAHRHAAGRRAARLRHGRRRERRRVADGAPRPHARSSSTRTRSRTPTLRAEPGREPARRRAARQDAPRRRRRARGDLRRAGARDALSRRHDRREHPDAGLRVAARPGAGVARGDDARDRAEQRRRADEQAGVRDRPPRRRRPRRARHAAEDRADDARRNERDAACRADRRSRTASRGHMAARRMSSVIASW